MSVNAKALLIFIVIIVIGVLAGLGYQAVHSTPTLRDAPPSTLPVPL